MFEDQDPTFQMHYVFENRRHVCCCMEALIMLTFKNINLSVQHLVPELRSLQVLLVFCLISAYELGPGPISWFIAAELFDQPGRPIAMAFTSMLNWGGKFVLALLFPPLLVGLYFWPARRMSESNFRGGFLVFLCQFPLTPWRRGC